MDYECQSIVTVIEWPLSNKNNSSFAIKVEKSGASDLVKVAGNYSESRTFVGSLLM